MATVVNFIDTTLQAASSRALNLPNAAVLLSASTNAFHVNNAGANDPASITFTGSRIAIEGTISFACTGGTLTVSGDVATLTYANMSAATASVTASITANGVTITSNACAVTKVLDGANGTNAAYVAVSGQQVFSRATSAAAFSPTSITLTATPYGGAATYQWQYWTGSAWTNVASSGAAATYAIASGDFTDQRLYRVQATIGSTIYTDQFTMVQVTGGSNGINAITGFLTNESVTLAADNAGTVASFAPASGTFKVYDGITDKTGTVGPVTYSVVSQTGCTVAITTAGAYSISAMSADTASATLQAVYGGVTIPLVLSLAKSRAGATGASVTGPRGAGHFYATGAAWSDTVADAACPGGKVVSDVVTISNGTTYSLEKKWDGSTWSATGVVIDGNLLVTGSVKPASLDTKGIIVRDNAGVAIVGIGVPLATGYEAPGTKNSDVIVGGRNLYSRTTSISDLGTGSSLSGRLSSGFQLHGNAGSNGVVRMAGIISGNGTYTISFDVAVDSSAGFPLTLDFCDGTTGTQAPWAVSPTTTMQHVSHTFDISNWSSAVHNFIDFNGLSNQNYFFTNFKVEVGNKETTYTPSPEDVAADTAAAALTSNWSGVANNDGNKPANGATVGAPAGTNVGSTSATTVESGAANGATALTAINDATTGLAQRLRANAATVLAGGAGLTAGTLTYDTSGNRTSGFGMAFNQRGIVGFNSSGVATITMDVSTGAVAVAGDISGSTGTFGAVTVGTSLNCGQSAYNTGNGFWLGLVSGTAKFSVGNSAGSNIRWDGSTLTVSGQIIGNGNLTTGAAHTADVFSSSFTTTVPFVMPRTGTVIIKARVNPAAGDKAGFKLYNEGSVGFPGTVAATSEHYEAGLGTTAVDVWISQPLTAGNYWLGPSNASYAVLSAFVIKVLA